MDHSRYLSAIAIALRDAVQPNLPAGRTYDAVGACIRALVAIAESQTAQPAELVKRLDELPLLPELRDALIKAERVPANVPAEDLTVRADTREVMAAGAHWLSRADWLSDPEALRSARALLNWARDLGIDAMSRIDALERRAADAKQAGASVPDVSAAAIQAYLRTTFGEPTLEVREFRFLTGGRVRQTVSFSVVDSAQLPGHLVLQREHPGAITELRGLSMQFALLEQLHAAAIKVPRPILVETSAGPLGAPFMLVERLSGAPPIASMDYFGVPPRSVSIVESLAEQMALLHRQPIEALVSHLDSTLKSSSEQSWINDVNDLGQAWLKSAHAPSLFISAGLAWMRSRADTIQARHTIVHGDMLLHNLLTENESISGILDWELAHIGHPAEDLGYVRPVVEQMADWSIFVQAYHRAGGPHLTPDEINFFTIRSIIKLITIIHPARAAFEMGRTDDPNLIEAGASFLPKLVNRLSAEVTKILSEAT